MDQRLNSVEGNQGKNCHFWIESILQMQFVYVIQVWVQSNIF